MRVRSLLLLSVALLTVVAAAFAPAAPGGPGKPAPSARAQAEEIRVMRLPMVGGDSPARFALSSPGQPGTTCTRLATRRGGQAWSDTFGSDPQRFTFQSNQRAETAWRFAVYIHPAATAGDVLLPLRAWLNLRFRATAAAGGAEGHVVSHPGGLVPTPAAGGGWVIDDLVREPPLPTEFIEVFACIAWGPEAALTLALDEQRHLVTADANDDVTLVASWRPSIGVALLDVDPVLVLPGTEGLLRETAAPADIASPLRPPGSLAIQAFATDLPATARVRTLGIFTNTAPGRTTITFELVSATGGFDPTIRCQGPLGETQFQLSYRVLPGVPLPFVQHFSSPTVSPNARPADFTCQMTAIRATAVAPPQAQVIAAAEDVVFNRTTGEYETLVALFNPGASQVSLSGWTLSAALYAAGSLVGFQDEPLDSITLAPGEYRRVVVRQPPEARGLAPSAIAAAFSTPDGVGGLRVSAALFRRPG